MDDAAGRSGTNPGAGNERPPGGSGTGKGLADLIRERTGVRVTAILLLFLVFVNLANTVSEFAGVAASMEIFSVSKYISVPLAALLVWLIVFKGNYKNIERIFLVASTIFIAYILLAYWPILNGWS